MADNNKIMQFTAGVQCPPTYGAWEDIRVIPENKRFFLTAPFGIIREITEREASMYSAQVAAPVPPSPREALYHLYQDY